MENMEKRYLIGSKTYVQRPVVLGQLRAVLPILERASVAAAGPGKFILTLSEETHRLLAAILVEEGLSVREAIDRLEERALDLECAISPDQAVEVISDFFECNRGSAALAALVRTLAPSKEPTRRARSRRRTGNVCSTGSALGT